MGDLLQFLLFLALLMIPATALALWLEHLGYLAALQAAVESWFRKWWYLVKEKLAVKEPAHAWRPMPISVADKGALLLHDIELATNRQLLVSFDKVVYVTRKHRREIARYLQTSNFEQGAAAEVFARHGYRLVTTRSA